jgi:hypothetical protein
MIAIVIARTTDRRTALHLAVRFEERHPSEGYVVRRITRGVEFDRRPWAVCLLAHDTSEARFASLEVYRAEEKAPEASP